MMGKYDNLINYLRKEVASSERYVGSNGNDYELGMLNGMKSFLFEVEQFEELECEGRERMGWK